VNAAIESLRKEAGTMLELVGQELLVTLLLGEDAMELDDWNLAALHEEEEHLTGGA